MTSDIVAASLANWLPVKLLLLNDTPHCQWLYTGDVPYTAPFFDETISRCRSLPENSQRYKSCSAAELLPIWAGALPFVPPSALIFHVSRCGSTLLAQLLGLRAQSIVLAEAPFFDALLRLPYQADGMNAEAVIPLLSAAIQFYGQQRRGDEQHLFIKTDSWHLCFYRQWRAMYPAIPFLLLYRSPDEVIRSQRRQRGMQSVQGVVEPALFGFDAQVIDNLSLDDYMVLVLERYFTILLQIADQDPNCLLLNYEEPVLDMMNKIAELTGIPYMAADWRKMEARSFYHAKYPDQVFREPVADDALPAGLERVMALYRQLDAKRLGLRAPVPGDG